ncbi:hypothetical protein HSX11_29615 [Oxalobacteraceae bacterium]|nr:hypothetical protein [Oxalobacteraceae bacterium]
MKKTVATLLPAACLLLGVTLALPSLAQDLGQAPQGAPRVPTTHSVEQANATLAEVARDRAAVHARYADSEKVCAERFFVNNCLDKAKEERRAALADLRAIEVEASHFKRKDSVDQRDRELAERLRQDENEQAGRMIELPKSMGPEAAAGKRPTGPSLAERQAGHEAKLKRQQAEQAAGAGQRAANVAAFEKKQRDAERRQQDVAEKKSAKAKKAADAAKAEQEALEKKAAAAAAAAAASKK